MKQSLIVLWLALSCQIVVHADDPEPSLRGDSNKGLGEYVQFKASGVKIRQPDGFEQEVSFEGFGHQKTQSSILAMSLAGPYAKMSAGFTKEQMKARGWTLLSKEEVKVDDLPGVLVHFQQPAGGKVFLKWSLIFGTDDKTTMVTATFPKEQDKEFSARLKSAVLSTRPSGKVSADPADDVPFTLAAPKKLKVMRAASGTLAFTKDGKLPVVSPEDPMLIVAQSLGKAVIDDRENFAERRLKGTALTKGLKIASTQPIKIGDLEGYESLAEAKESKSDTPLTIYQVILFEKDSYFLIQGLVGTELHEEYLPEFKSLARSFRKREAPKEEEEK